MIDSNQNTGYLNTGYYNTGNWNTGDRNTGDFNSGSLNTGDCNTGKCNTWCLNTSYCNTGDCNTGYWNTGNRNAGCLNTGYRNTGDHNTGNCNTGDCNTGDHNTGDWNSGHYNTGDWNKSSYNSGCFNTVEHTIFLFDKPSPWTYREFLESKAKKLLDCMPQSTAWVNSDDMTDAEKAKYPTYETTGGYLKTFDAAERTASAVNWWNGLIDKEKAIIMSIPNFDKEIFKEITGIDVDAHEWY